MKILTGFAAALVTSLSLIGTARAEFRVDESTGDARYRYDFPLPPARGRFQPTLALVYNSSAVYSQADTNVGFGAAWTMSLPTLTKVDEAGTTHFYYSDGGSTKPLLPSPRDGTGRYAVDVEDRYMSFRQFVLSTWYATDGAGNEYEFDSLPVNPEVFHLTRVTDLDGNRTNFNYQGTQKGMILSSITYHAYDPSSPGSTGPEPFPNTSTMYGTTIELEFDYSLQVAKNIRIKNMGSSGQPVVVRRYEFAYQSDYIPANPNDLSTYDLISIREIGKDTGQAFSPTTFTYTFGGYINGLTTASGAHYDIAIVNASGHFVVRTVTLTGPAIPTTTTRYWYANPTQIQNWFNGASEPRGFAESWWRSDSDNILTHAWWEVGSHAFTGVAAQSEWVFSTAPGTDTTPPSYARSDVFKREVSEHSVRSLASGACTGLTAGTTPADPTAPIPPNIASEVGNAMYPVTTFTTRVRTSTFIDSLELASQSTVACADVDTYGHVLAQTIDPDVSRAGDESVQRTRFVVAVTPTTPCIDCVDTRSVTDTTSAQGLFSSTRFSYDATWRLNGAYAANQPNPEVQLYSCTYNGNGTLASKTESSVTTTYQYGAFGAGPNEYQARLTQLRVTDGVKALVTDYGYDDFGYRTLVTGPYLQGSAAAKAQKATAYDDFGRPRLMARNPIAPGGTVSGALIAYTYSDYNATATPPTMMSSVTMSVFAVPLTFMDRSIPQTSDVQQSTTYLDSLGRAIQTRERLGGTGASDPSANITQNLSGYRVSTALVYDGAGRLVAELEPFYSVNAGFVDYRVAAVDSSNGTVSSHVTLHGYDSLGREVCRAYQALASNSLIPAAPATCRSSFGEDSGYVRANAIRYRGFQDGQNGPTMVAIKSIPAENNVITTPEGFPADGPESLYGPSGRLHFATTVDDRRTGSGDLDHNRTVYIYDPLGRLRFIERRVSGGGRAAVIASIKYDMMGRVTNRSDPNTGATDFPSYDAQGRLLTAVLPSHVMSNGFAGRDEIHFAYDLGRPAGRDICTAVPPATGPGQQLNCVHETWVYDAPYQADPSYQYVAGHIAYVTNGLTTIAFGYNLEGTVTKRGQQIAGLSGTFNLSGAVLVDGQRVQTDFASQYGNSSYRLFYDSMRRVVHASSGSATLWDASAGAASGAYDPVGRVGAFTADNGFVQANWQYGAFSGKERSARVTVNGVDVYNVTSEVYLGSKLTSCTDQAVQTNYRYWYNDAGQLRGATATPFGSSSLAQTARLCMSYNTSKTSNSGPSLGNLERVRNQSPGTAVVETYNYPGVDGASWPDTPDHVYSPAATSTTGNVIVHDFGGRVSTKSSTAESFQYDSLGRLTQVTRDSAVAEILAYDPMGAAVGRLAGGTLTYYIGTDATITIPAPTGCSAPGCLVGTATVSVDFHAVVGTRRIASVRTSSQSVGRILYYHRNRLGSVVATSLAGGAVGAKYAWGVHGELSTVLAETPDTMSELGFTGSLRLSGGLLLMGRRVYDPKMRQFLQPDAIDPMTYTYAAGDPVNFIDPSGLMPVTPEPRDTLQAGGRSRDAWWRSCSRQGDNPEVCVDVEVPDRPSNDVSHDDFVGHWLDPRSWQRANNGGGAQRPGTVAALLPMRIFPGRSPLPTVYKALLAKFFPKIDLDRVQLAIDPTTSNRGYWTALYSDTVFVSGDFEENSAYWLGVVAHELTHMNDFVDGVPVFHQILNAVSYAVGDIVYGYRSNPLENDARAMQFLIEQTYGRTSDLLYPPKWPYAH